MKVNGVAIKRGGSSSSDKGASAGGAWVGPAPGLMLGPDSLDEEFAKMREKVSSRRSSSAGSPLHPPGQGL